MRIPHLGLRTSPDADAGWSRFAALCAADDVRSATSCTYDASRLALDAGAVHALLAALEAFADAEGGEDAATAALDALRQVAKSDDAVKRIREAGGARACLDALRRNRTRRDRCRRLVGLLRNMANNDDAKDAMCKDGTLEEILGCLERFLRDDAVICEHVVATLAMMALRRPKNGTLIVEGRNGASLVIHAMGAHPAHAALFAPSRCADSSADPRHLDRMSDEASRHLIGRSAPRSYRATTLRSSFLSSFYYER